MASPVKSPRRASAAFASGKAGTRGSRSSSIGGKKREPAPLPHRPGSAGDVATKWERELRGEFTPELTEMVYRAWVKADKDSSNTLTRDEMESFMADLYEWTGMRQPPEHFLQSEIGEIFQAFDLDRSNTIEVHELAFFLKRSDFRRQVLASPKWRSPGRGRGSLTPIPGDKVVGGSPKPLPPLGSAAEDGESRAGSPASFLRKRRAEQQPRRPWDEHESGGISEASVPVTPVLQKRRVAAAADEIPAAWAPAQADVAWVPPSVAHERLKELAEVSAEKPGSVLDELAENLSARAVPPQSPSDPCYAQLRDLAEALYARHVAPPDLHGRLEAPVTAIVVLALVGSSPQLIDRLLGAPAEGEEQPRRASARRSDVAFEPQEGEAGPAGPRNPPLLPELASACLSGGDAMRRWAKTLSLLCCLGSPLPERDDSQEWRVVFPPSLPRDALKDVARARGPSASLLAPACAVLTPAGEAAPPGPPAAGSKFSCAGMRLVLAPPAQRGSVAADAPDSPAMPVLESVVRPGSLCLDDDKALLPPLCMVQTHRPGTKADPLMTVTAGMAAGEGAWEELRRRAADDARFADAQLSQIGAIAHEKRIRQYETVFRTIFNSSGSGKMSAEELTRGMRAFGEPVGEEECALMMAESDADGDGKISFDEFAAALLRTAPPAVVAPARSLRQRAGSKRHGSLIRRRVTGELHRRQSQRQSVGSVRSAAAALQEAAAEPAPDEAPARKLWTVVSSGGAAALHKTSAAARTARPARYLPAHITRRSTATGRGQQPRVLKDFPAEWAEGDVVELPAGDHRLPGSGVTWSVNHITIRGPAEGGRARLVGGTKSEDRALVTVTCKRVVLHDVDVENAGAGLGLHFKGGHHDLIGCRVTAPRGGVLVEGGCNMLVSGCVVHDCRRWGLCMRGEAVAQTTGIVESSEFRGNSDGGLVVEKHAAPWVSRCQFRDGKGCGVVFVGGAGSLSDSDVSGNVCAGIWIEQEADPVICRNRVHHGGASGIKIENRGRGTIEDNEVWANGHHEIEVLKQGCPTVRRNLLRDGTSSAVYVAGGGQGLFEGNTIRSHPISCVTMGSGGAATVVGNTMFYDGKDFPEGHAVAVRQQSRGTLSDNTLVGWAQVADDADAQQAKGSLKGRVPPPFGVTGSHDVVTQDNWIAATLDEAKAMRRQAVLARFPPPKW
eukprot:TRINITY_DN12897_c0_g2_i2.p1 TRINITY_DN12897_c0_g2~~TRINITY_DN12897_c0_g2_i2.p1  ORF type:complete len:1228 (+),score=418.01 TRINITY_DN12897_c0_g2_i2:144-3686(+)